MSQNISRQTLEAAVGKELPSEPLATCSSCPMCSSVGDGHSALSPYNPLTKCCTYWPSLPNYSVGGVLQDNSEESARGRSRIQAAVASLDAVPRGLGVPLDYQLKYSTYRDGFGRNTELLCPYFDENAESELGNCTVWSHRTAVCSTWFCKFEKGLRGQHFWDRSRRLLLAVESAVSIWCATSMGITTDGAMYTPPQADSGNHGTPIHPLASKELQRLWGSWFHRREEFYIKCYGQAQQLTWAQVENIGGAPLVALRNGVREAYEQLQSPPQPRRVTLGAINLLGLSEDGVMVRAYRPTDVQNINKQLFAGLITGNWKDADQLRAHLLQTQDFVLEDASLQRLIDLGVIRAAVD